MTFGKFEILTIDRTIAVSSKFFACFMSFYVSYMRFSTISCDLMRSREKASEWLPESDEVDENDSSKIRLE